MRTTQYDEVRSFSRTAAACIIVPGRVYRTDATDSPDFSSTRRRLMWT